MAKVHNLQSKVTSRIFFFFLNQEFKINNLYIAQDKLQYFDV